MAKRTSWVLAAILLLVFVAPAGAADESKKQDDAIKAMMEAWTKYATPGPAHKELAGLVGRWDVVATFWPAPGAPPQTSKGISEMSLLLDGRYLLESFTSPMPERVFQGMGITGYDNLKRKVVSVWIDTMGTGLMVSEGTRDASGVLHTVGTTPDPVAGKDKTVKGREWTAADGIRHHEMWEAGPDGKDYRTMEILYTRK